MNDKTFTDLTKTAARRAERACIRELKTLHWDDATIQSKNEDLSKRLTAECRKAVKAAVLSFEAARKAGAPTQVCEAAFCIPFISAGVQAAVDADKASVNDFWSDFSNQQAG